MTPILQQDCRQHAGRLSRFQPHSGLTPTCTALARHKWEEVSIKLVYPDLGTPSSRGFSFNPSRRRHDVLANLRPSSLAPTAGFIPRQTATGSRAAALDPVCFFLDRLARSPTNFILY